MKVINGRCKVRGARNDRSFEKEKTVVATRLVDVYKQSKEVAAHKYVEPRSVAGSQDHCMQIQFTDCVVTLHETVRHIFCRFSFSPELSRKRRIARCGFEDVDEDTGTK